MSGTRLDLVTPLDPVAPPPATPTPPRTASTTPPPAPPTTLRTASTTPPPPATFTRDELDAAEPERHPSAGFRWMIGFGLGTFAALYVGFPLGVAALPFAFTGAGAGMLVGSGLVVLASLAFDAVLWLNADLAAGDPWAFASWSLAGVVALAAGVVGTVVVMGRARRGAGA